MSKRQGENANKLLVTRSKAAPTALQQDSTQYATQKGGKKGQQGHQTQVRNPFGETRNQEGSSIQPRGPDAMQSYVLNRIEMMKKTQALNKKIQQLAAFVPDFILREDGSRKIPYQSSADAVVFMVDVSGFTKLTEAFSLKGKGGTDQLTKTLFAYISPVAEAILQCDGDIVKYAGDAFLAFWLSSPETYEVDIQRAVDCALYIQEKYGSYLCVEVDITIKVKVGIGAGIVHLCGIGNESYQHYVCFGPGVEAASEAERHCNSGEVIMSPAAWMHCNPSHFRAVVRDETFRAVSAIYSFINPDRRGRPTKGGKGDQSQENNVVRPIITQSIESRSEDFLRRFVIPPVLRKLDDDIPLDYLNESRLVCICFIHVETVPMSHEGIQFREAMCQIVNKAFIKIYQGVTRMQGALTKVIMFDKGLTYLIVFGLPGYVNENQCAHALKFSHATRRALLGMQGVQECSIGVTTGSCYSGVMGHAKRQEYTVMGRKVNKAARLMVYYPGRVSCDQDTASHSKLNPANFELQEYKELKGIANPGKIYEFVNQENQEDNSVAYFMYPMVGRDTEFRYFKEILTKNHRDLQEHCKLQALMKGSTMAKETVVSKGVWMCVFEGDNGIGKSRLLAACMTEAESQTLVQVFSVAMTLVMTGQSLYSVSSLVMDAIGIGSFRTPQEREDYLKKKVQEPDLAAELCVCNDILHTKFPLNPKYTNMDSSAVGAIGQHVLASLLKVFFPEDLLVFAVDDAHYMDQPSWDYIMALAKSPHILVVLTLRRTATGGPKIPDQVAYQMYHNKNIKVVRLNGLDTVHCKTLACQMMEVAGIPGDLEKILIAKSQGNPAYIEHVVHALLRNDVIKYSLSYTGNTAFVELAMLDKLENKNKRQTQKNWAVDDDFSQSEDLKSTKSGMLRHQSSISNMSRVSEMETVDPKKRFLILKGGTMGHVQIPGSIHENLLDMYDELNSNEQIVLKCASILGRKFSRVMVTRILPNFELNARKYESAFNHLMEMKYIRCASGTHPKFSKDQSLPPDCFCKDLAQDPLFQHLGESVSVKSAAGLRRSLLAMNRPKYWTCKFMEFTKEALTEVVYELMTEDQRKGFHLKAAKYLDSGVALCEACGGHNTAYAYGFVLKGNEMMETEGALKAVQARQKRNNSDAGHGRGPLAILELRSRHGWKRISLQTQINGMKDKFKNDGSRIAQIEYEVLSLLRKIDVQVRRKNLCCPTTEHEWSKELAEELALLRDVEDDTMVRLKGSDDSGSSGEKKRSKEDDDEDGDGEGGEREVGLGILKRNNSHSSQEGVDLRFCECSAIQARVCIEMVKHYREAQKYGKCMINLLEAAESSITIGNGSQGLIHLEDATGLLKSMQEGKVQRPDKDDQDDVSIEDAEIEGQIEYLNGLAYFEIGVYAKSKDYFLNSLARLGLKLRPDSESKVSKQTGLLRAKAKLWTTRYLSCCLPRAHNTSSSEESVWSKKLKILSYLHTIFKQDRKLELALLVSMWEVVTAERWGDVMHDLIPAYCNMMSTHTAMANHKGSKYYEKLSLNIIRETFSANNEPLDATGLLTTAGLFHAVAYSRLCRGEILMSSEAAYLGLRIAQTIHDNTLMVRLLPTLAITLLKSLRIPELVEALQKLWYIAEEEDDVSAMAVYYSLSLDLLLRTAYPLETFVSCEQFVITNDTNSEQNVYKDFEVQFAMECSLALWYARYSRWDESTKWLNSAETHRPKLSTYVSVEAEMKLLETHLIFVNYYLDGKKYQNFAKARSAVKEVLRSLTKTSKVAPVLKARHLHLMAYYYRIRSRNVEAEKNLKHAEKLAIATGNDMEVQWIKHSRNVWSNNAPPVVKFFWLERTEHKVLDWHTSGGAGGKVPWSNVMYSLPIPPSKDKDMAQGKAITPAPSKSRKST